MASAMNSANPIGLMHDWFEVADNPRHTDAMQIAAMYNVIGLDGKSIAMPSVNTDSVVIIPVDECPDDEMATIRMLRIYTRTAMQNGDKGSRQTNIAGDFFVNENCRPTLYDDNVGNLEKYYSKEGLKTYNQVIFAGFFPLDNPQYTICVTMDNEGSSLSEWSIKNTVNSLAEYLSKHRLQ